MMPAEHVRLSLILSVGTPPSLLAASQVVLFMLLQSRVELDVLFDLQSL